MASPRSFWARLAAVIVLLSLSFTASAQSPTQTWVPSATCTAGLANGATNPNGTYTDIYSAQYSIFCGQENSQVTWDQNEGTNGRGAYGCFQGCDFRPSCIGWTYIGTVSGTFIMVRSLQGGTGLPRIRADGGIRTLLLQVRPDWDIFHQCYGICRRTTVQQWIAADPGKNRHMSKVCTLLTFKPVPVL
jgi:hypothetical protein